MRRCLVNTLPRQEVPCKAVRFLIRESGFSGEEENAQPRPREVTVDLKEPVARWFDEMLASAQKESLYRQWNRPGMNGEFTHFLEEYLASQMKMKTWERSRVHGGRVFRRSCIHPLCTEILEAVSKEGWYSACRLHLSARHGLPLGWVDIFLSHDKAAQAT
jgi:hypothetical protein